VYGTQPLTIGAATVARQADAEAIIPASNRPLTFGGRQSVTIPPGASVLSDAVALNVPALSDVAIDLYVPGDTSASESPITQHSAAIQTSYTSMPGDHTGRDDFPVDTTTTSWFFLARVDVVAPEHIGAVVLFGDSITDGSGSTLDTNNRWPDHLARRLHNANIRFGILNLGIAGNRVLSDGLGVSALARFDREVLAQPGVTHVIVLEGINDIGLALTDIGIPRTDPPPTAADIIFGHQQLIERARTRNVQIYGATFLPFAGTSLARIPNYYSTDGDTTRQTVNAWIRTSGAYDAVIDFDAALQNPEAPLEMLPRYDSGDGLHPGDTGYEAMANTLDLELLQVAEPGNAR
jgi:lysophospholipase L1-like esterase